MISRPSTVPAERANDLNALDLITFSTVDSLPLFAAGLCAAGSCCRGAVSGAGTGVGAVLSDLSGRRGRVTGTEPDPNAPVGMERTVVHAEVPESELVRYAITLRSLTAGTGRFTRAFSRLELVPPQVADTLRKPAD